MSFYQPAKLPRLMVAPNGARKVKKDHPAVPLTISETVATAKSCYEAGAGAIHLHVRDKDGQHVLDAGLYKEALNELEHQVPKMQPSKIITSGLSFILYHFFFGNLSST